MKTRYAPRGGSSAHIRRGSRLEPEIRNPRKFQTFQNAWAIAGLAGIPYPGKMRCPSCGSSKGHEIRQEVCENRRQWVSDCQACGKTLNAWAIVMMGLDVDYGEAKRIVREVAA